MFEKELLKKSLLGLLERKGIRVNKIIVFGSHAKGKVKEESDIDIIIVSKDFRDKDIFERVKLTRGVNRGLVKKFMKPFDLIYYSDEEWENGNSLIINAAKEEGEVVYG